MHSARVKNLILEAARRGENMAVDVQVLEEFPVFCRIYRGNVNNVRIVVKSHYGVCTDYERHWVKAIDENGEKVDSLIHSFNTFATAKKHAKDFVERCVRRNQRRAA